MTNPVRFSGAVHEAGHALVAHALSATVGAMSVANDGAGKTEIADQRLNLPDRLTVCMAGMVAQNVLGCERGELACFRDYVMANNILNELGIAAEEHWPHIETGLARAHAILKSQLNKVRAIAAELAAHGQLDADRVQVLLAGEPRTGSRAG
jgi:hypothetical protein